ncbi:Shedu immune nuclease family protein [Aeromonas veronii]|uniref:Shedu immune nuclease family protein n=1 Tax=Aeromonas TaxID=642 RepID=UPI00227D4A34|nr:Shedu immune nuclease family protein [Aeromonas dhakensis]WAF78808.1 DUF4263 domain-containing protein [Aeromonas dhakensis]
MKNLQRHILNPQNCRTELNNYNKLLTANQILSEQKDVLPFFKKSKDLSLLICSYFPKIKVPDLFAHEYELDGDFVADLIVGDSSVHQYLLIEFENGAADSVFKKKGKKATPDWAPRFEGAYSQLIDWLWKLEDKRSTADFVNTFGSRRATFQGLIVIGKDMKLSAQEKDRLKWRMDRTMIDSNAVSTVSFDDLAEDLDHWLRTFHGV